MKHAGPRWRSARTLFFWQRASREGTIAKAHCPKHEPVLCRRSDTPDRLPAAYFPLLIAWIFAGKVFANDRAYASAGLRLVAPLAPARVLPLRKTTSKRPMLELTIISSAPSDVRVLISAPSCLTLATYFSSTSLASLSSR